MKSSISINWMGNMAFEGDFEGHKIVFDADASVGGEGKGLRPKPMMLYALAGCTAMDVVAILKKMRVEFENLEVSVEAEMTEEHPKHYTSMHVIYAFRGTDLPMDKLEKAINLSEERYCGVGAVYRKVMPVTHEIRIME